MFTSTQNWLLILCSLFLTNWASAQVSTEDSVALVKIFEATQGQNWTNNSNWASTSNVGNWYGVKAENGRVVELKLNDNNLRGTLPADIGKLSGLKILDLGNNPIGGNVINEFFSLRLLEEIDLSHTIDLADSKNEEIGLRGAVAGAFSAMQNLRRLDVSYSRFAQIKLLFGSELEYLNAEANIIDFLQIDTLQVTKLKYLNLRSNLLTSIPDLSGIDSLKTLLLDNNNLQFGDLEKNITIETLTYQNQGIVGQKQIIAKKPGVSLELSISVTGDFNVYQWYKNDEPIPNSNAATYNFLAGTFYSTEAIYHCLITNTLVPNLTLRHKDIDVFIATKEEVEQDSLALVEFYINAGGLHWIFQRFWRGEETPMELWTGITLNGARRVTEIRLPHNNLQGFTPKEMVTLTKLKVLDFSNSNYFQIKDLVAELPVLEELYLDSCGLNYLPDFRESSVKILAVDSNRLVFSHLIPNMGVDSLTYHLQADFGAYQDTLFVKGNLLKIKIKRDAAGDQYQWFKEGSELEGSRTYFYQKSNLQLDDAGDYACRVRNPAVPNLDIYSKRITVRVNALGLEDEFQDRTISIFPNPASAILNIDLGQSFSSEISLQLVNSQGLMIRNIKIQNPQSKLYLNDLPAGFYVIKIQHPKWQATKKLVIQH